EGLETAHQKGVEQTNLDMRVVVQRRQDIVQAGDAIVVEQQAHAHATLCSSVQGLQKQRACQVVVPDVVLHIQRALGGAAEEGACGERITCVCQSDDSRLAGVGIGLPGYRLAEACCAGLLLGKGKRPGAAFQWWKRATRNQRRGAQAKYQQTRQPVSQETEEVEFYWHGRYSGSGF